VPLRWRGGGILDGLIDAWHRALGFVGKKDGGRPFFLHDAFRVEGRTLDGRTFSWSDDRGFGLGDLELFARWRLRDGRREGWSFALAGRAALPTGTFPFDGSGPGLGVQALGARPLGSAFDLFLGTGGTAEGRDEMRGIRYESLRGHAFLALEWRLGRRWSLVAETDAATRLVADIDRYPGQHWYLNLAAKIDASDRLRLELGFTENIADQQSTTDFALYFGLALRR
jgi:hypothetical protein